MTNHMNPVESTYPNREMDWKRTVSAICCILLVGFSIASLKGIGVTHATDRAVSIVDAANGTGNLDLNSSQYGIGDLLLFNVTISDALNVYVWQVKIGWNNSLLSFVSMTVPADHIFADKNAIISPTILAPGSVYMGAVVGPGQNAVNGTGTMAQLTLMIKTIPQQGQTLKTDIAFMEMTMTGYTYLLDPLFNDLTEEYAWNDAHYQYFGDKESTPFHDVAVTNIVPTSTNVRAGSVLNVSVTVVNTGAYSETLAVGVAANTTAIAENQNVAGLIIGASSTLTFAWNTSGWSPGAFTLVATAGLPEDASPLDNTREFGIVYIINTNTENAKIVADPPVLRSTAIGQNFVVNINVYNVTALYAWQAGLAVNTSSLKCTGFYDGGFLPGRIVFANATYLNKTMGDVYLVGASLFAPVEGVSGSGQLAHLTFTSLETGVFPIHLTDLLLLNIRQENIPFEAVEKINVDINGTAFDVSVTNNLTGAMSQPAASGIFNTSFSLSEKKLSFDALATKDWFCQIEIPKELLNCNDSSQWTVKVDGSPEAYLATESVSYTTLKFNQNEGYHTIEVLGTTTFGENSLNPLEPALGPPDSLGPAPLYVAITASICLVALAGALADLRKTKRSLLGFTYRSTETT